MKVLGFLVVCFTAVGAFVAPAPRVSLAVRPEVSSTAMRMGPKEDIQKAATGVSLALLTAAPALATEGTGEPLGIEESKGLVIPLFCLLIINLLFNNWAKDQPEGDFFGEYDQRR